MGAKWIVFVCVCVFPLVLTAAEQATYRGRIFSANSGRPIEGAIITLGDVAVMSESSGNFQIDSAGVHLGVRAHGYQRARVDLASANLSGLSIALTSFAPKALYLSFYGIGNRALRESALDLIDATEL